MVLPLLLGHPSGRHLGGGGGLFRDEQEYKHPSAMKESKQLGLICLREEDKGVNFCFAMIGSWSVCCSAVEPGGTTCLKHRISGSFYEFDSLMEWHLPRKPHGGSPAVFALPRLHDEMILTEYRDLVEGGKQLKSKWEEDIPEYTQMYLEWAARLDEDSEGELGSGESSSSSNKEDSDSIPGESILGAQILFSGHYVPNPAPVVLDIVDPTVTYDVPVVEGGPHAKDLMATRTVLDLLFTLVQEVALSLPQESSKLARFMGDRIDTITKAVNTTIHAISRLEGVVGDVLELEEYGVSDLSTAVLEALKSPVTAPELEALRTEVDNLDEAVGILTDEVDTNLYSIGDQLMVQITGLLDRVGVLEREGVHSDPLVSRENVSSPPTTAPPSVNNPLGVQDAARSGSQAPGAWTGSGDSGMSIEDIYRAFMNDREVVKELRRDFETVKLELVTVKADVKKFHADLASQGGVSFANHLFTSELDVKPIALNEASAADAAACFLCPISIFCHDSEYEPAPGWGVTTSYLQKTGKFTEAERKFVATRAIRYPSHYAGSGKAPSGKLIKAFKTVETWSGANGQDGQRAILQASLSIAEGCAKQFISDHLPAGSVLRSIAETMVTRVSEFYMHIHTFFDEDLQKLVQLGLSKETVLKLLSNYVIIIFDHFYVSRQKLLEFTIGAQAELNYQARTIWVALLVHREMAHFLEGGGMRNNSLLNTAYVRFITEEFGKSSSEGGLKGAKGPSHIQQQAINRIKKNELNFKRRFERLEKKQGLTAWPKDDEVSLGSKE